MIDLICIIAGIYIISNLYYINKSVSVSLTRTNQLVNDMKQIQRDLKKGKLN